MNIKMKELKMSERLWAKKEGRAYSAPPLASFSPDQSIHIRKQAPSH